MFRFLSRTLLAVPVWLAYLIPMTLLILLGFPIVALAAALRTYTDKHDPDGFTRTHWSIRWLWLYDNDEDGIDGDALEYATGGNWKNPEWVAATKKWEGQPFKLIFVWSAWRNSVGNARRVPFFGISVDPKTRDVYLPQAIPDTDDTPHAPVTFNWRNYRKTGPYLARSGWAFELRFPWSATHFCWIGWRIAQQDSPATNVGFAFQPWSKL